MSNQKKKQRKYEKYRKKNNNKIKGDEKKQKNCVRK